MPGSALPDFIMLPTQQLLQSRQANATADSRDSHPANVSAGGINYTSDACRITAASGSLSASIACTSPLGGVAHGADSDTFSSMIYSEYSLSSDEEAAALAVLRARLAPPSGEAFAGDFADIYESGAKRPRTRSLSATPADIDGTTTARHASDHEVDEVHEVGRPWKKRCSPPKSA